MVKMFLAVFLLSAELTNAQATYLKYRKTLEGLSCNDTQDLKHSRQNIPLLEKWISGHPRHYDAYYDLAMCYFSLSGADSLNRKLYSERCIQSNKQYIRLAPRKSKYRGYWNNALVKCWLKDCEGAIADLNKAKEAFKLKARYWDANSEKGIKKKCEALVGN
jgi:hypothetical protein